MNDSAFSRWVWDDAPRSSSSEIDRLPMNWTSRILTLAFSSTLKQMSTSASLTGLIS